MRENRIRMGSVGLSQLAGWGAIVKFSGFRHQMWVKIEADDDPDVGLCQIPRES